MPTGPQGQRRPGGVIGAAVHVARIATGEVGDETKKVVPARAAGEVKGEPARALSMSIERRREVAKKAAEVRWSSVHNEKRGE